VRSAFVKFRNMSQPTNQQSPLEAKDSSALRLSSQHRRQVIRCERVSVNESIKVQGSPSNQPRRSSLSRNHSSGSSSRRTASCATSTYSRDVADRAVTSDSSSVRSGQRTVVGALSPMPKPGRLRIRTVRRQGSLDRCMVRE